MMGAAELADARADAEREMSDRIRIKRQSGSTIDDTTLIETPAYTTLYDDQPAFITTVRIETDAQQAGATYSMTTYIVHVPTTVDAVQDGDIVEVISSGDSLLPTMAVESTNAGTATITRALTCVARGDGLNKGDYPEETS